MPPNWSFFALMSGLPESRLLRPETPGTYFQLTSFAATAESRDKPALGTRSFVLSKLSREIYHHLPNVTRQHRIPPSPPSANLHAPFQPKPPSPSKTTKKTPDRNNIKMFRTALLRTAQVAARPVAALPARRFASAAVARPAVARVAPRAAFGVRSYSGGGALQKEEVEGRIMSLLQGFDKVSSFLLCLSCLGVCG